MGGLRSQNKGKRGEREVIKILQPVLDVVYPEGESPLLQRNTLQSDRGGFDIVGLEWLGLEVKHQESYNLNKWWEQTVQQVAKHQEPVLFYRKNNVKWRVRMLGYLSTDYADLQVLVDVSVEDFLEYFKSRVEEELGV